MADDIQQPEPRAKRAWTLILAWIGGISAALGLIGAVTGLFGNIQGHLHHNAKLDAQMSIAQSQFHQGDYQASVQSYADILKADPLYGPALDQQLQSTMLWVEGFQSFGAAVAPQLDQIITILEAGLTRTKGAQAADVQAHLGWAHWLNQHVAEREFPPNAVAERNYRAALAADPQNAYANAMLGNWLTQNAGSLAEAIQHFNSAVATGRARPFVRMVQLAGLKNRDEPGSRAALMKALNDMRKNSEPLDEDTKHRILGFCCDPAVTDHVELAESLSAVSAPDAWQTYVWLDDQQNIGDDAKYQHLVREFIAANIAEISGDKQKASDEYRALQDELKGQRSSLKDSVSQAIARLSHV
jgi:Tfp pilus assembly protein PilF